MDHWRAKFLDEHCHFIDEHWHDGHWIGVYRVLPRSGYERRMSEIFDATITIAPPASRFDELLDMESVEARAAELFDGVVGMPDPAIADELFARGLDRGNIESVGAVIFDSSLADTRDVEARAAQLFDENGRNADMFAETITYDDGVNPREIKGIFIPDQPVVGEETLAEKTYREARLLISYDATDGVETPVAYVDMVTIRGEKWTVLPVKDYDGGHWSLRIRRHTREDARTGMHTERRS